MTQRTRRLIVTLLTFLAVTVAAGILMRYVIAFVLANEFSKLLAMVLIGSALLAIFCHQNWLWGVFIVAVLLQAGLSSGYLAAAANEIWILSTVVCGVGGTAYIRRG